MEEQIRKTAIERLIKGESPKDIYTSRKGLRAFLKMAQATDRSGENR